MLRRNATPRSAATAYAVPPPNSARHPADARSFGRPAVTAECAAPFLVAGGALVVSEPPPPLGSAPDEGPSYAVARAAGSHEVAARWPPPALTELGFGPATEWRARGYGYVVLRLESLCAERYPRRNGIPAKRPLF